jgi:hypothetical protein
MAIKAGGLLARAMKIADATTSARVCETCENLVMVSENTLGCAAHDKFIIPEFPPYHTYMKCEDWVAEKGVDN